MTRVGVPAGSTPHIAFMAMLTVWHDGICPLCRRKIALMWKPDTRAAIRTLETIHPPSYYIPRADIAADVPRRTAGSSFCEWKGAATYWDVAIDNDVLERVAGGGPVQGYSRQQGMVTR